MKSVASHKTLNDNNQSKASITKSIASQQNIE